ncbi:hypothetical protein [Eubacterium oxidoreducens]|uniref:Uncharacterized protein n=1 Tax=Eubacterium oxidoreducens TaxID=1732 RepID=A0A1G6B453_EUBOX|nr:hypothetical protein [Eubacterium oxidoreducens]SDB15372.1 hypothetical protein SAMN02910417_01144 [Eubacterium oxidoreducens]
MHTIFETYGESFISAFVALLMTIVAYSMFHGVLGTTIGNLVVKAICAS